MMYKIWASFKKTAELLDYIGDPGELFYSKADPRLRISDGVTPGGILITQSSTIDLSAIAQNLAPAIAGEYNIGTPDKGWKNLYIDGEGQLFVGTQVISIDQATNQLVLPAGTQVIDSNGNLIPVGTEIDPTQINLQIYLDDLVNTDVANAVEGSLMQLQNGTWKATNVIDTQSGDLVLTGGIY